MTGLPADAVLIALVGIIVQLLKPWVELAVPPSAREHDPLIRSAAVGLAVALTLVQRGLPADGPTVIALLGYALGTAMAAIGGYHLISGSASPSGAGGDSAPETPDAPAPTPLRLVPRIASPVPEPATLPKAAESVSSAATTAPA